MDLKISIIEKQITHQSKIKENQLPVEIVKDINEPENPYPSIFPNEKCWQLFEYWKENSQNIKTDLCYIYWLMTKDKLMYPLTPSQYSNWLNDYLKFDLEGFWKQLYRIETNKRNQVYSLLKIQYKLNNPQYLK